jgi:hypothetical protein
VVSVYSTHESALPTRVELLVKFKSTIVDYSQPGHLFSRLTTIIIGIVLRPGNTVQFILVRSGVADTDDFCPDPDPDPTFEIVRVRIRIRILAIKTLYKLFLI